MSCHDTAPGAKSTAAAQAKTHGGCCPSEAANAPGPQRRRIDWLLWGSLAVTLPSFLAFLVLGHDGLPGPLAPFAHGVYDFVRTMWWGVVIGAFAVGALAYVPRDVVMGALAGGRPGTVGILRATAAGVAFDLCSHGILMVGMKLYERGASAGQTIAFLLASPWNSLSLTLILIALVGWGWTLAFILLSGAIAVVTGLVFDAAVARGALPGNPNTPQSDPPRFRDAFHAWRAQWHWQPSALIRLPLDGLHEGRMVLRWLAFGIVLAAAVRAFVPIGVLEQYFGPTLLGLLATIGVATLLEVCSEGSTPLAADLLNRAGAPGNGFAFLMAGVATDYTEVMSIKDTMRSWRLALALPVIAVPQIVLVAWAMNLLTV